jgi:hypothetical protein
MDNKQNHITEWGEYVIACHQLVKDGMWTASCNNPDVPNVEAETEAEAIERIKEKLNAI